jgi:hypothetical protein
MHVAGRGWERTQPAIQIAPCGCAIFPREIMRPPRAWAERLYNVTRWTAMPAGGHFAAMEDPAALVDEIRAFFRPLRCGPGQAVDVSG